MIATMTSKGQVTFPKSIRDLLKLETGDKFDFRLQDDGKLLVVPITASVTQLKGMLPAPKKAVSLEEMEVAIAKGAMQSIGE